MHGALFSFVPCPLELYYTALQDVSALQDKAMLDLNAGWWTQITPEKLDHMLERHPELFGGLKVRRYALLLEASGEWSTELQLYVLGDSWPQLERNRHSLERTLRGWLGFPANFFITYALDSSGQASAGWVAGMN